MSATGSRQEPSHDAPVQDPSLTLRLYNRPTLIQEGRILQFVPEQHQRSKRAPGSQVIDIGSLDINASQNACAPIRILMTRSALFAAALCIHANIVDINAITNHAKAL